MGACLSCLGLGDRSSEDERTRLLADDPYSASHRQYGGWQQNQAPPPPPNALSPAEAKRQREALDDILRWASNQIVEIFPTNTQPQLLVSSNHLQTSDRQDEDEDDEDGDAIDSDRDNESDGSSEEVAPKRLSASNHQDILLSMIPGDKSKRSIRIYPASRPSSKDATSIRSKASQSRLNTHVLVQFDIDLPPKI